MTCFLPKVRPFGEHTFFTQIDPKKVGVKIEETISVEPITVSFSWILGKPRSLATTRGKEICCWMAVDMESD